jgi:TonB-dependent starch-binding outer membrane protein SusC
LPLLTKADNPKLFFGSNSFNYFLTKTKTIMTMKKVYQCLMKTTSVLVFLFTSLTAFSQDRNVSGTVKDETGNTMPGVNVLVKGTTNGTATDADGKFTLSVPANATLVLTFVGYTTSEVTVGSESVLDVKMVPDAQTLSEVVVVGYTEQKKVTVTGAVVAVNGSELQKSPAMDLTNSLTGRLAGVSTVNASGEPGYDGATIRIRGANTLGNNGALIVIDGIPDRDGGINRLSPQDIESISVLKDAASAIYGARAANGVILVTTKRGKTGAPKISYDFNQGWGQPTRIPKMSDAVEYANIMNEIPIYKQISNASEWGAAWDAVQATGTFTSPTTGQTVNANFSPTSVQKYKDGSDPWGHPNTDWFGDALKTWSPQSRHNLQISGGNENIKYLASGGYQFQDGIYKNSATFYKQYNLRVNVDARINKYINTGIGIMLREESRNFPTQSAGSIFRMLMRGRPTEPEVWPNGLPGPDIENGQNPYVVTTNQTGYVKNPTTFLQTNAKIDITNPWVEGLKLTLMGSLDKTINKNKVWETPWYLYTWDKVTYEPDGVTPKLTKALRSPFSDPRLTQSYRTATNTNLTAMLNYERTFGEHYINIMAGTTREKFEGDYLWAYRREYISSALDQPFAGGPTQLIGGGDEGSAYNRTRVGAYGRVAYNYKEKYLLEFIWRRDASSIFPPGNQYGFFPGVLAGWNIGNESFFSENITFINRLKIRGSYGEMGNDRVAFYNTPDRLEEYAFLSAYLSGNYPINNQVSTTLYEKVVANQDFTWEVAKNTNIGFEGAALGGKLTFEFDYFYNKRDKILIQKTGSTPSSSGIANILPPVNEGRVDNKGFDIKVDYAGQVSDLKYSVGFNSGYAKNKVVYMDENPGLAPYQVQTGKPYGAYLAYVSDGAFLNQAEIDASDLDYSAVTTTLKPGDMKFKDIGGSDPSNGYAPDGKIDAWDRKRLDENNTPRFTYGINLGLTYKSFDLSILFQGATGALLQFGTESGDIGNYLKYSNDNRWTIDNPSSTDPRLAIRGDTYYTGGNYGTNTYFLWSKNYMRLKNLELGFTVPQNLTSKIGINNVRLYVNGLNLITWDNYKVFDPETTTGSGQYYPQSRVINTGIRVTF